MGVPLKKNAAKTTSSPAPASKAPAKSASAQSKVQAFADQLIKEQKAEASKPPRLAPKSEAPKPQKRAASNMPSPLNRQIPRKPARMPVQDIPLEVQWKLMQDVNNLAFYITPKGQVKLWAPKVHWTKLKEHWKQYTPMPKTAVFTHRDEYWCPHCAAVMQFKWLACTDDLRCTGCGVPNYDKAVVKANYGEVD